MAAFAALILMVAAIVAVIFRVREHTSLVAEIEPGDPSPPFMTDENQFMGYRIIVAVVVAILLFTAPLSGWSWGLVPLLVCLVMAAMLMGMAVEWPETERGDKTHGWIWGEDYLVTDPDIDDRLDSNSPNYVPAMDEDSPSFDQAYFEANAIERRSTRHGALIFFGGAVVNVAYVAVAWVIAGIVALASGNIDGPSFPGATGLPAIGSTASAPAPSESATAKKPSSESTLDDATCAEVRAALQAFPTPEKLRRMIEPRSVERCVGKGGKPWELWSDGPEGSKPMIVTHSYRVEGGYHYMLCTVQGVKGEVLIRYVP